MKSEQQNFPIKQKIDLNSLNFEHHKVRSREEADFILRLVEMPLDELRSAAKKLDNATSFSEKRKRAMYIDAIAWNYYCDNLSDRQLIEHHSCSILMCHPKCSSWQAAVCLGVSGKHYRARKAAKDMSNKNEQHKM